MITEFQKKVYKIVSQIPKGSVMTYKEIAIKLKTSPRAVGQALKRNPFPLKIPCHRVIHSNGKIGGYKGVKNSSLKKKLLKEERFAIT